jgi:hypothetical protein
MLENVRRPAGIACKDILPWHGLTLLCLAGRFPGSIAGMVMRVLPIKSRLFDARTGIPMAIFASLILAGLFGRDPFSYKKNGKKDIGKVLLDAKRPTAYTAVYAVRFITQIAPQLRLQRERYTKFRTPPRGRENI